MAEPTALRTLINKSGVVEDLSKTTIIFASDWTGVRNWFAWVIELIGGKQASLGFTAENVANKKTVLSDNSDTYYPSQKAVKTAVDAKQDTLVSGSNIKTINGVTVLGSTDIVLATLAGAEVFTNKRITKRTDTQTNTATITPEISTYDIFIRSAQAQNITINNHSSSTPADGDMMLFEILGDATPRAVTYGNKYVAKAGTALPSMTVASKNLTMLFIWRADLTQWNLLYAGQEA